MISWNFDKRFPPKFVCLSSITFSTDYPKFIRIGRLGFAFSFIENSNNERFWTNPLQPGYQNPKSESMDFFAEIDHISIKIWICGEESKFNVITKFGGKSPHHFWEITKNRCLVSGRCGMRVLHFVPTPPYYDFVKLWKTFSTKICMPLKPDIFQDGPQFYSNR